MQQAVSLLSVEATGCGCCTGHLAPQRGDDITDGDFHLLQDVAPSFLSLATQSDMEIILATQSDMGISLATQSDKDISFAMQSDKDTSLAIKSPSEGP